jgi:phosphoribosylformylglycinamidine synthase
LVILLGSTTGRDGIGGASVLASQEFDEAAENKRPAVQVGDPFTEKLLIEACLELLRKKLLVALGDLGAAGLTSSASEMASRGGVGIDIDVQKVPRREPGMQAFEVMVSESQERMLAVAEPGKLDEVLACCEHWGVMATVIGTITDTGRFVVRDTALSDVGADQIVADMPAEMLAESAPVYDPPTERPAYLDELAAFDTASLEHPSGLEELTACLIRLLASSNISSRAWIYRQYDHQVMNNTAVLPGADAAVLRIGDTGRGQMTKRGIAVSTDCNGRWCYLDPYRGAQAALAEGMRNLACVGAMPAAITDCLNFGNPEKPEVYWTFVAAVDGLSEACSYLEIPVISGNVSFYNESFGRAIYPTPTIGIVGLVEDVEATTACSTGFKQEGDTIILVGQTYDELGGSEYLKVEHGLVDGVIPALDLELERDVAAVVRNAVQQGLLSSAHDLSSGGLAVALAECCIASGGGGRCGSGLGGNGLGGNGQGGYGLGGSGLGGTGQGGNGRRGNGLGACVVLDLDDDSPLSPAAALFAESNSRILVSLPEEKVDTFIDHLLTAEVPYSILGEVTGDHLQIEGMIAAPVAELANLYKQALEQQVNQVD